jgi:hypothetical protein
VGERTFLAAEGPEGEVCLTVRPEEVALSAEPPAGAPNVMRGRLVRIVDRGALIRVDVQGDLTLVALLGRRAFHESGLGVGHEVTTSFDPTAVHIFPAV